MSKAGQAREDVDIAIYNFVGIAGLDPDMFDYSQFDELLNDINDTPAGE